jgi:predicted DNA-binding transcriptional regulator AlpA
MESIPFEKMPQIMGQMCQRLENIEALIREQKSQPETNKEEFLTLKQVSELTGYACPTLYGLIGKNAIPHFKRGQRLFFDREAIINWIKAGKRKSKAEFEADADTHLKKLKMKR